MSRWASSTNATAAAASSVQMVVLVDLDLVSGHVRAHDGIGALTHGGQSYLGVGQYGGLEFAPEDMDVSSHGARLTLTGIPADLAPDLIAESGLQNRPVTITLGLLNTTTGAWIDTPEVLWDGWIDTIEVGGGMGTLELTVYVEDELRRLPLQAWNTDADQQIRYPGDKFFYDLGSVEVSRATWGQAPIGYGTSPGRPSTPSPGGGNKQVY